MAIEFPAFLNSTNRANHRVVDTAIEGAREVLQVPQVVDRLGSQTTYLLGLLDRAIIPNVRHGEIKIGKGAPEDALPILAVKPNQQLKVDPLQLLPNSFQQTVIEQVVGNDTKQILVERFLQPRDGDHILPTPTQSAVVTTKHIQTEISFAREGTVETSISGRPFLFINNTHDHPSDPFMTIHELFHVQRDEKHPLIALDPNRSIAYHQLSHEIEAYTGQHEALQGAASADIYSDKDTRPALKVTYAGRKYNDPTDPWRSSADIARALVKQDLLITMNLARIASLPHMPPEAWEQFNPPAAAKLFR